MDKTERTIAKVTNAGRILSRIAWIFDLIACGCSAFLILAALLWWNTRPDLFTGYASQTGALLICAGDLIGCAGSAVLAYFARQHFAHALEAQTPFTLRGAAEQKRLGILILCISPATMVLRVALSAAFSAEFMPERLAGMLRSIHQAFSRCPVYPVLFCPRPQGQVPGLIHGGDLLHGAGGLVQVHVQNRYLLVHQRVSHGRRPFRSMIPVFYHSPPRIPIGE